MRLLRTRGRRIGLALVVPALVGVGWFLLSFGRIAAGYAATITALQVFGSGDSLETVRAERLEMPLGLGSAVALSVDRVEQEARAVFMGLIERRARWRPGLGATRTREGDSLDPARLEMELSSLPEGKPWPTGESAELAPLAPAARLRLEAAIDRAFFDPMGTSCGTHAIAVVQNGRLVAERYRPGYDAHTRILGWSMTKSVTATLFARLIQLGRVADVSEPAAVPEWQGADDPRRSITYDQLLRMTSGLEFFANYSLPWSDSLHMLFASRDVAAFAARKELAHPPGTVWSYSDGTSNILGRCIRVLAAEDPEGRRSFPQRELFAPLGMTSAVLSVDAAGNWVSSSLMQASARDWARFGWLYANDGVFEGERLLPEGWVEYAARATPASSQRGYGAHFWRYDAETGRDSRGEPFPPSLAGLIYASGHEGQYVWIDRARRIVLARLGVAEPASFEAEQFASEAIAALTRPDEGVSTDSERFRHRTSGSGD